LSEPIRITEVLNYLKEPWYTDWVCKVGKAQANRTAKLAMKVGSRVDELIKTNGGPIPKDNEEVITAMGAFDKWKSSLGLSALTTSLYPHSQRRRSSYVRGRRFICLCTRSKCQTPVS